MIINRNDYKGYAVTGKLVNGKRFCKVTQFILYALGINLYKGSVWGIRKDTGRRQLLRRVYN